MGALRSRQTVTNFGGVVSFPGNHYHSWCRMRKSSNPALNLALNPATYWWLELRNCSLNLQCRKHHKLFADTNYGERSVCEAGPV